VPATLGDGPARWVLKLSPSSTVEVFERDAWVCGICALPVDRSEKYPEPGSPSLDHIVPLSKGGPHTRANTRLAHLYCNMVRGNREVA
jgi:5-methylcytosine-specific restriction endonuclease McrA